MSLSRKLLESMGLEADKVSTIIENHAETVDGLKAEITKYKGEAERIPALEAELSTVKEQLGVQQDNEDWKAKFEKEHNDFETFKSEQSKKATKQAQEKAFVKALKEAGITSDYQINLIIGGAGEIISGITFDSNGNVENAEALNEQITSKYSGSISTTSTQGVQTITPPNNDGAKLSKEEILAITDTSKRRKAIEENHELFGF